MAQITDITTGPQRQSNMELLRIVATLLILVVHADFYSLSPVTLNDFDANAATFFGALVVQFLSVVGVNVFILISGWFGIRSTLRGATKLLFQCSYFALLVYVCAVWNGWIIVTGSGIINIVTANKQWFVVSYLGLMILAPALNALVENVSRKTLRSIIIAFFIFQTFYGNAPATLNPIALGYSTFSFLGLYLLGRYVSIYRPVNYLPGRWLSIYFSCTLLNVLFYTLVIKTFPGWEAMFCYYINPLNIIGACGLVFAFARIKIRQSHIINYISASAFAAFLLHASQLDLYKQFMLTLDSRYPGFGYAVAAGVTITIIFAAAILLDQPRKLLWTAIDRHLFHRKVASAV